MFKLFITGLLMNLGMLKILNCRGEAGTKDAPPVDEAKFTQADLDRVVQERLGRERAKYGDYEDLRKFKEEHAKAADEQQKAELAKQKKYEEAESLYQKQLKERDDLLGVKDRQIEDMKISGVLSQEISKQNGFAEETIALLRNNAAISKDGVVTLKLRDANGLEKELSVEEGLKQFYSSRPHLLRAKSSTGGSGTPPAGGQGGGAEGETLAALNSQLIAAMARGDQKTAGEIKKKIRANPQLGNSRAL